MTQETTVIEYPAGRFDLGDGLDIDGPIELRGASQNETTLVYTGSGSGVRVNSGAGIGTKHWLIRDLTLDGNGIGARGLTVGQGDTSPHSGNKGSMQNVIVTGFTEAGGVLDHSQINRLYNVDFSNNTGDGLRVLATNGNTDTAFFGCYFKENKGRGVLANGGYHFAFHNCLFELNKQEGVWLQLTGPSIGGRGWLFDHCYWERNNYKRAGTGHAQFRVSSDVEAMWFDVGLTRPYFYGAGTDNHHVLSGPVATLLIEHPEMYHPPPILGADTGEASCNIRIWDQYPPRWTLGGGSSPVTWHELPYGGGAEIVHGNDGSGSWTVL